MNHTLTRLDTEPKRLIMIGGKGGVGKTTCASAIALHFALQGKRTLIISSDPTPSLSDIFEMADRGPGDAGSRRREPVGDRDQLRRRVEEMEGAIRSGDSTRSSPRSPRSTTTSSTTSGARPGLKKSTCSATSWSWSKAGSTDLVVWDTAPAGHTLRLLHLPQIFLKHLEAATKFYMNLYSYLEKLKETVKLRKGKRSLLEIISGWEELAEKVVAFIRDASTCEFIVVTIPEALGVRQTERIIRDFADYQLEVNHLIVNHVIKDADCDFHRVRREMQQHYIKILRDEYADHINVIEVPLSAQEVKGVEKIRRISAILFGSGPS